MRANMPAFGKTSPLTKEHFSEFEACYGGDPYGKVPRVDQGETGRFRFYTRVQVASRNDNLDIAWLRDESDAEERLTDPDDIAVAVMEHRIRAGELADVPHLIPGGQQSNLWSDRQQISNRFLETVLLDSKFSSQIPPTGVWITAAWISESLALFDAEIPCTLRLEHCRFDGPVELNGTRAKAISFHGSEFNQGLNGEGLILSGLLNLGNVRGRGLINLVGAEIGFLDFPDPARVDVVNCFAIHTREGAVLRGLKCNTFQIANASIGTNLFLENSVVEKLNLGGLKAGNAIDISECDIGSASDLSNITGDSLTLFNDRFRSTVMLMLGT
jgi:hypothetical protein